MLKIENYGKLFRQDVLGYRVAKIIENERNYKIQLLNPQLNQLMVYVEREAIDNQYEIWVQKQMKAERMFFEKCNLETIDSFLSCIRILIM